ncbi:MAG: hypothetical protein AAFY71_09605 [Bacteroidota bacterium]
MRNKIPEVIGLMSLLLGCLLIFPSYVKAQPNSIDRKRQTKLGQLKLLVDTVVIPDALIKGPVLDPPSLVLSPNIEPEAWSQNPYFYPLNGPIRTNFVWLMPDRFGTDRDKDGLIDLFNQKVGYTYPLEVYTWLGDPNIPLDRDLEKATSSSDQINNSFSNRKQVLKDWLAKEKLEIEELEIWINGILAKKRAFDINSPSPSKSDPFRKFSINIAEGDWEVEFRVKWKKANSNLSRSTSTTQIIRVKNYLIVGMGDSVTSGEGNPDKPAKRASGAFRNPIWADGVYSPNDLEKPTNKTNLEHAWAHRSTAGWSALAALDIERTDPLTSVSYINVASGGASIQKGLLKGQLKVRENTEKNDSTYPLPSQFSQLDKLLDGHQIDFLPISIGGNDAGLMSFVAALIIRGDEIVHLGFGENGQIITFEEIEEKIQTGEWRDFVTSTIRLDLGFGFRPFKRFLETYLDVSNQADNSIENSTGLDELPIQFERLDAEFKKRSIDPSHIFFLEYYANDKANTSVDKCKVAYQDFLADAPWIFKDGGLLDLPPAWGNLSVDEQNFAYKKFIRPLNKIISNSCGKYGWNYLSGINKKYENHVMCYRSPNSNMTLPSKGGNGLDGTTYPPNLYKSPETYTKFPARENELISWYINTFEESEYIMGRDEISGVIHPNRQGHAAIRDVFLERIEPRLESYDPFLTFIPVSKKELKVYFQADPISQPSLPLSSCSSFDPSITYTIPFEERFELSLRKDKTSLANYPLSELRVNYSILDSLGKTIVSSVPLGANELVVDHKIRLIREGNEVRLTLLTHLNKIPSSKTDLRDITQNSVIIQVEARDWIDNQTYAFKKGLSAPSFESLEQKFFQQLSDQYLDCLNNIIAQYRPNGPIPSPPIRELVITAEELIFRFGTNEMVLPRLLGSDLSGFNALSEKKLLDAIVRVKKSSKSIEPLNITVLRNKYKARSRKAKMEAIRVKKLREELTKRELNHKIVKAK